MYEPALATVNIAIQRLLLAGWQLGTRAKGDPESDAVRDHREATLVLRAEVTALSTLLIQKGVVTREDWLRAVADEADWLNDALEAKFPGVTASEDGLTIPEAARLAQLKINAQRAGGWLKDWKP